MNTHDFPHQLLAGTDVPAVVPIDDDQDHETYIEVRIVQPLPEPIRW
jgi:hypothetical protein